MVDNVLLDRFKVLPVSPSKVNDWIKWMDARYGEEWDKRIAFFIKRFEAEGYFLKMPKGPVFFTPTMPTILATPHPTRIEAEWSGGPVILLRAWRTTRLRAHGPS
jgi:hypothetical protein